MNELDFILGLICGAGLGLLMLWHALSQHRMYNKCIHWTDPQYYTIKVKR